MCVPDKGGPIVTTILVLGSSGQKPLPGAANAVWDNAGDGSTERDEREKDGAADTRSPRSAFCGGGRLLGDIGD